MNDENMQGFRDKLEVRLRGSWESDDLSVYGDFLLKQAFSSDVFRGMLCALDLKPSGQEYENQREHILQEWLGDFGGQVGHLVQHGVVRALQAGPLARQVLSSELGELVCDFAVGALEAQESWLPTSEVDILGNLELLAATPRPWLRQLAIHWESESICSLELCEAIIAATPNLEVLYCHGNRFFESFHHASLQHLYVSPESTPPLSNAKIEYTWDCGALEPVSWCELELSMVLAAIWVEEDCNQLHDFDEMLKPHDSLFSFLLRAQQEGLVELNGTRVRLSKVGRALVNWPKTDLEKTSVSRRRPGSQNVHSKFYVSIRNCVLRGDDGNMRFSIASHLRFLARCLDHFAMSIDDSDYEHICKYLDAFDLKENRDYFEFFELKDANKVATVLRNITTFLNLGSRFDLSFFDVDADFQEEAELRTLEALIPILDGARVTWKVSWGA